MSKIEEKDIEVKDVKQDRRYFSNNLGNIYWDLLRLQ